MRTRQASDSPTHQLWRDTTGAAGSPDDALETDGEPTFALVRDDPGTGASAGRGPASGAVSRGAETAAPPTDIITSVVARHPRAIVTEGRVELDGRMVRYSSVGSGQPVVLLPDRDDTARAWQGVIDALSETHLLISMTLPGYGEGSASFDQESAGGQAALLRGLLKSLGQPPVSMIGHGLGAVVALLFADYYPDLTRRLVLIDATAVDVEPTDRPSDVPVLRLASEPHGGESHRMPTTGEPPSPERAAGAVHGRPADEDLMSPAWLAVVERFLEP